ncbi:MAG: acyl-CoA dehydrogenase family protein [Candidatus Binatia bacterium]
MGQRILTIRSIMFELNETQRLVEQAMRQWCTKELQPLVAELEAGRTLPFGLLNRLGNEIGVSAPLVAMAEKRIAALRSKDSEKNTSSASESIGGGFGEDPMLTSVLLKELGRVSPGFALSFISTLGCGMAILSSDSVETIERYAVPVLKFDKIGCWALTEPEAGSDAFGGMRTTAVVDGDELVINGQKIFITNAPHADVFAVYARVRSDDGERVQAVVVERGNAGLETGPPMAKLGVRDSPTAEVFLNDCRVPLRNLVGRLGGSGSRRGGAALGTLNLERAVMPAICLGIIERCVEESVSYAGVRKQFGRTIGEFQGVAFKLARMELALENARNLVLKLAWAQRKGKFDARLASIAKLYCAEEATRTALEAIQIHGGAGYMSELPFEKLMRDAKLFEIGGGTNEIQLQTIARCILR